MLSPDEAYQNIFRDYPDVVNVKQMCEMLGGIGEKMGYRLLHSGKVQYLAIGRNYRIPKINVIGYLSSESARQI